VVPPLPANAALFLDVDRTVVDFQLDSLAVRIDDALRHAIAQTWWKLDGALALLSGRSIAQLDRCVGWDECAAAGIHGLERRDAQKVIHRPEAPAHLRNAVAILIDVLSVGQGVKVEDKGVAVALHFHEAPEREAALRRAALLMLTYLGPQYRLLEGAYVIELLPRSADKGTAVRAFMAEAPFRGRQPVFVGDDVTGLDGFQAARELGGYGVAVGSRIAGDYTLVDVQAVRRWLGVPNSAS
jgi:trehalose 6-phosphate phosphatase